MPAGIRLLKATERVATPWKNGGGVTREVCRDSRSAESDSFDWRVSIAEVAQAGPFSRFTGYRRLIALIDGPGMQLRPAQGEVMLLRLHEVHAFDGDTDVIGALPLGPVSDLNVIFRAGAVNASLRFSGRQEHWQPGEDRYVILINVLPEPSSCVADGRAMRLERFDAVLATSGAELSCPAGGAVAIIEIDAQFK